MERHILAICAIALAALSTAATAADFTFVQISDTHVSAQDTAFNARYREVIRQINALDPDLVIHTGDAVQGMSEPDIALFKGITASIAAPVYTVPGNHDIGDLGKDGPEKAQTKIDAWKKAMKYDRVVFRKQDCVFIGLDGNLWNSGLAMEAEQMKWLESQLQKAKGERIIVFQHSPLFVQTPTDPDGDYFAVANPARSSLLKLFKKYKVEAVLTGHYHRAIDAVVDNIRFITTPATSFSCAADQGLTGYSVFRVYPGGFSHRFVDLRTTGIPPDFSASK